MRIKNIDIQLAEFFTLVRTSRPDRRGYRRGYTLVEMLLSVVLTLMLMYGVAEIFSMVGNSVNDSRALLGIGDRLRATQARLELDLEGVTSRMTPPAKPENNEGYFELIEGPVGPTVTVGDRARNTDESPDVEDTTAIDYDDILMFTTRTTTNEPFIGRAGPNGTVKSRFAEVAWFVRGRTLYRRVKIVKPDYPNSLNCTALYGSSVDPSDPASFESTVNVTGGLLSGASLEQLAFENQFDLSARFEGDRITPAPATWGWVPNSLSDLTKRENRMYHTPILPTAIPNSYLQDRFPFSPHDTAQWQVLGLPTAGETSNLNWMLYQWNRFAVNGGFELPVLISWAPLGTLGTRTLGGNIPDLAPANQELDFWNEPYPYDELDPITGNIKEQTLQGALQLLINTSNPHAHQRVGEDVILNNVIGFDVKVWDPEAPIITVGNNVLKPGDTGFPANYVFLPATNQLRDLASGMAYAIVSRGAYVDLGQNYRPEVSGYSLGGGEVPFPSVFCGSLNTKSGLVNPIATTTWSDPPSTTPPFIYDTWSTHYEFDGIDQDPTTDFFDASHDGIDNDPDGSGTLLPNGLVDDPAELDTLPPYPAPLEAIQIKIRVFEPESQQVREVTIVHKF